MNISIIIPALNEEKNLSRLLGYLRPLSEDKSKVTIIVVDAIHSVDNTEAICMQNEAIYIRSQFASRSRQMNEGAAAAHNDDILYFLHADVLPPTTYINDILLVLNDYDAGMFCYRFDKANWLMKINAYVTKFDSRVTGGGDQGLFLSKKLFNKLGGYDNSKTIMEDFDFFNKMKRNKVKYTIVQHPCIVSGRKYRVNSWLRVNLVNLYTVRQYNRGVSDEKLKTFYKKWLISSD